MNGQTINLTAEDFTSARIQARYREILNRDGVEAANQFIRFLERVGADIPSSLRAKLAFEVIFYNRRMRGTLQDS